MFLESQEWRKLARRRERGSQRLKRVAEFKQYNGAVRRCCLPVESAEGSKATDLDAHRIIRTPSKHVPHPPMNSRKSAGRIQAGTANIAIKLPSSPSALSPLHSPFFAGFELSPSGMRIKARDKMRGWSVPKEMDDSATDGARARSNGGCQGVRTGKVGEKGLK